MNWKQILSLTVEDLQESEKDQLCTDLAWFDYEGEEELDETKYHALLKLSQEILKYKSEQVEILLYELDQLAIRQGEEEAKKASSDDLHSPKSKKSVSSPDLDEVEIKYRDIKSKFKQQIKVNNKQKNEIEKLQRKVEILEREKIHLQDELQSKAGDESSSDLSESVADKQKQLITTLHQRNHQISSLLSDIEAVEHENITFREHITTLQSELADATNQLTIVTEELNNLQTSVKDYSDRIDSVQKENEFLQQRIKTLEEENANQCQKIDENDAKIADVENNWKLICDEKNKEIKQLKLQIGDQPLPQSPIEPNHSRPFKDLLIESENKICELKAQLQHATIEMEQSAKLLTTLKHDNNTKENKLKELSSIIRDLKVQIKSAHERCQALQTDLEFTEKLYEDKSSNFKEVTKKLQKDGFTDLSNLLNKNEQLKFRLATTERDLAEHVKIVNKLQDALNKLENENVALREKCGISTDEEVNIRGVLLRKRKDTKEMKKLESKIEILVNEKLNLQMEIEKLNRRLSVATDINLGEKEMEKPLQTTDEEREKAYVVVVEENEALRNGLHEILNNIHKRNESSDNEIKSVILSKLLKALDQRHIAGWYHPAMRLQAELHELHGVNLELRTQLKTIKNDLKSSETPVLSQDLSQVSVDQTDLLLKLPKDLQTDETKKEGEINEMHKLLEELQGKIEMSENEISSITEKYEKEKLQWKTDWETHQDFKNQTQVEITCLQVKLNELLNSTNPDYKKNEKFAETCAQVIKLNRKQVFLEHENEKLNQQLRDAKDELVQVEISRKNQIEQLKSDKEVLSKKVAHFEKILSESINAEEYLKLKSSLDSMTLKYRELLTEFNSIKEDFSISLLNETIQTLQSQKEELRTNLLEALSNKHTFQITTTNKEEFLSRQLAQSEINELAEKQRANHMSNLYEVVKEQLEKTEERFKELEIYNKQILHKNLFLQESFIKLEECKINSVDLNQHNQLQESFATTLKDMEKLTKENYNLKIHLNEISSTQEVKILSNLNDTQILNLKHQILDLQSESDDKALIARLSSDVIYARIVESDWKRKYEMLKEESISLEQDTLKYRNSLDQEKLNNDHLTIAFQNRICLLKDIIKHQRERYLGSLPLVLQEVFASILKQALIDKHSAFIHLQTAQKHEHDAILLNDELKLKSSISDDYDHREKNALQLKEFKLLREMEFKESQLQQTAKRLQDQEEMIMKMQEDLLYCTEQHDPLKGIDELEPKEISSGSDTSKEFTLARTSPTIVKQQDTQTSLNLLEDLLDKSNVNSMISHMEKEIIDKDKKITELENLIHSLKSKNLEIEMNLSLFRTQIGDRQSQIAFYEKHIMELQNKLNVETVNVSTSSSDNPIGDEIQNLKELISKLTDTIVEKDKTILNYQTLIKECKDEHSLAASRMQDQMKQLQDALNNKPELNVEESAKALIEQYIQQVHALEQHADELHTTNTTMSTQLKSSRQEAVRWRSLASDRLQAMDQVRKELESQHQEELVLYKTDSNKWREEALSLKQLITKYKSNIAEMEPNLKQVVKEKDDKIRELTSSLRNYQSQHKKPEQSNLVSKLKETETVNETLKNENQTLRKRLEEVIHKKQNATEEARNLREKLVKKPIPLKSDRSDKEVYQKKVAAVEKELHCLKERLKEQTAIAQNHKEKVGNDFEKWKKYKFWQQTAEKLKEKVFEQKIHIDKQIGTINCYKTIKDRLEREKRVLENQIKSLRNPPLMSECDRLNAAYKENEKLMYQVEKLSTQLENQKQHAGGLGASLLQEKLEGQERKIAVLEMSSKGTNEIRAEIERLQESITKLQKANLHLEAENLDLKLDLEKYGKETPHLREQIAHLENYIEVLKMEQSHVVTGGGDQGETTPGGKKAAELERTVLVLKRVVEKLQVENKRLQGGSRPCTSRTVPSEKLRLDYLHLKDQLGESIQKVARLEEQLKATNKTKSQEIQRISDENTILTKELVRMKDELFQKNELLNKVKSTLQRAAFKEKNLQEEVNLLKQILPNS